MDKYTEYGFEWELDFKRPDELFIVIPERVLNGVVELTEQDLRDMLAEIEAQKG